MNESEKDTAKNVTVPDGTDVTEVSEADVAEGESPAAGPKEKNTRLRNAVIRMAAALVAAALILTLTSFAPIKLLKGAQATTDIANNASGDYVSRDVYAILGFYAEDVSASGNTLARYALVPMGGKLVTVKFSQRYLDSADGVCDNTYDYINGKVTTLDKYVKVEGTVGTVSEDTSALMYDWFGVNYDQLVEMKMISETDDYSDYLSSGILYVDTVGNCSETEAIVLGAIAAALVLYAIVEIILMAIGFYLPDFGEKQALKKLKAAEKADGDAPDDGSGGADADEETEEKETEPGDNIK